MSGFVKEVLSREEALNFVSEILSFPWDVNTYKLDLLSAVGKRLAEDIYANEDYPPFSRSTRDGYAVRAEDTLGSSQGYPSFLTVVGEIPMGAVPNIKVSEGEAALVYTGGAIPEGADAVVMVEHTSVLQNTLEVRKSVQRGENIICKGEDVAKGKLLLKKNSIFDFRSASLLSGLGISKINILDLSVGVVSTGDEVVPEDTPFVEPGKIRDSNSTMIGALLKREGYQVRKYGIALDDLEDLMKLTNKAMDENDVVILSGGSSVSSRDFTIDVMNNIGEPGLVLRGLNISPGKPTLVGGNKNNRKLLIGLPGHPLSCSVVMLTFVLSLLASMIGAEKDTLWQKKIFIPAGKDIYGRSGVEEFIPAVLNGETVYPSMAKSGFISALRSADGLVRLPENRETVRKGEPVEVWLW
ncbi:MAG: molybdopterin molybdotransferase [Thermovirga sp.]|nr:molybdopterin molybdotransferase [Thermovirga sp.]